MYLWRQLVKPLYPHSENFIRPRSRNVKLLYPDTLNH
uniref:Uncharacterized protein n=1 Tax=Arundo donax TaxID=35708 RepID=A0A0A9HD79_ARUDO